MATPPQKPTRSDLANSLKNIKPSTPDTKTKGMVSSALGITQQQWQPGQPLPSLKLGRTTISPVQPRVEWAREKSFRAGLSGFEKAMMGFSEGPVMKALMGATKPLSSVVSGIKETVDWISGDGWSGADYKRQVDEGYFFGDLLHDFDILQGDAWWEKWGARTLGFVGDVALDPLTYLGLVGKGVSLAGAIVKGGGREIAKSAVRQNLIRSLGDDGVRQLKALQLTDSFADDVLLRAVDDIAGGTSNVVKRAADGSITIDLSKHGGKGGKGFVATTGTTPPPMGGLVTPVTVGARKPQSWSDVFTITIDADTVGDVKKLMDMNFSTKGATGLATKDLQMAARHVYEGGLDQTLKRSGGDALQGATRGFKGNWFKDMKEVSKLDLQFGLKIPGTGPIGKMIFKHNLQRPVGMRMMSASTPLVGTMVRGVPQTFRKMFFGLKHGEAGLIGWMKRGGRLPELRKMLRSDWGNNPVNRHAARRVLHAAGRGDAAARVTKQEMMRVVKPFFDEVKAAGADTSLVYHALAGSEEAAQAIGQDLTDSGIRMMAQLREIANTRAGYEFLGESSNYVPRVLGEKARDYLEKKGTGLVGRRWKKPYEPTGFEKARKYISRQEYDQMVADEGLDAVRAKGVQGDFLGEELVAPGTAMPDGSKAPDVEQQIADIMDRMGIQYGLFDDDIAVSLPIYIDSVAQRTGEVFTETLLRDEGILVDRAVEFIKYPNAQVSAALQKVSKAQQVAMKSATRLQQLLRKRAEDAAPNQFMENQVAEAEAIFADAEAKYIRAQEEMDTLTARGLELEAKHEELKNRLVEASDELARIRAEKAGVALGISKEKLVELTVQEQHLVSTLYNLLSDTGGIKGAYDSALNASVAIVKLEDMVLTEFGSSERFQWFVDIFGDFDQSLTQGDADAITNYIRNTFDDPEEILAEVQAIGQVEIDRLLDAGRKIVTELDDSGTGSWIGVTLAADDALPTNSLKQIEASLDVLHKQVEDNGQEFKWWLQLLKDLDPEGYAKFMDDSGVRTQVITPDDLMQAKGRIDRAVNQERIRFAAGEESIPISQLAKDNPELQEAIQVWYGSVDTTDHLAASIITSGNQLDEIVHAIKTQIETSLKFHKNTLRSVRDITFSVPVNGKMTKIGWDDYVNLVTYQRHAANALYQSSNTAGVPAKFPNADDLVDGPHEVVILGVGGGNRKPVNDPDFIFSAENLGLDPATVTPSGRNWVTTAYTQMVVAPHAPKGGSNAGVLIKVPRSADDPLHGEGFYYYIKSYTNEMFNPIVDENGVRLVAADSGRVRAEGEVVANALYRAFDEMGLTSTGSAPVGSVSRMKSTRLGAAAQGEYMLTTDYMDNVVTAIDGSITRGVVNQSRVRLKDGTFTIAYKDGDEWMGVVDGQLQSIQDRIDLDAQIDSMSDLISKQMMVDIITANWDALGNAGDNVGINNITGELLRLDNGGTFHFSAMGGAKVDTGGWDWRDVSELLGFGDTFGEGSFFDTVNLNMDPAQKTTVYSQIKAAANAADGGGFEGMMADQLQKLLRIRSRNGGWDGFVAHALGTGDEIINADAALFANFLEVRTRKLAEVFNIPFPEGDDLIKQSLVEQGIDPALVEDVFDTGFSDLQELSERLGLRPWLSSADPIVRDGLDQRSQWIFSLEHGDTPFAWVKSHKGDSTMVPGWVRVTTDLGFKGKSGTADLLNSAPLADDFNEGLLFKDEVEDIYDLEGVPTEEFEDIFKEGTEQVVDREELFVPQGIDPDTPLSQQFVEGINDQDGDIFQRTMLAMDKHALVKGLTPDDKMEIFDILSAVYENAEVYQLIAGGESKQFLTAEAYLFDVIGTDLNMNPTQLWNDIFDPILKDVGVIFPDGKGVQNPLADITNRTLNDAIEQAPFTSVKEKFVVLIYDEKNNPILRVPVGGVGLDGVTGVSASYKGMSLIDSVKQAAREQLGGEIQIHGALQDSFVAKTKDLDSDAHHFVGRIVSGGGIGVTGSGPITPTRDKRVLNNVVNVLHGSQHVSGVLNTHESLGTLSGTWMDTGTINGSALAAPYMGEQGGSTYTMRINMSQNVTRNVKMYGIAPHKRGSYGHSISNYNAVDPMDPALQGADATAAIVDAEEQLLEAYTLMGHAHGENQKLIDSVGAYQDDVQNYGLYDMQQDMLERAANDPSGLMEEIISMLKNYETLSGNFNSRSNQNAAVVLEGINILSNRFEPFNRLGWREKLTFLGWLNTGNGVAKANYFRDVFQGKMNMASRTRLWAKLDNASSTPDDFKKALNDLLTLEDTEVEAFVNLFLADMSQSGAPNGKYFKNRVMAEGAAAINYITGVGTWYGGGNIMTDWISAVKRIAKDFKIPELKKVEGGGFFSKEILLGVATAAKVADLPAGQVKKFLTPTDRHMVRLHQRFREVWRRSLSADGYDMAFWANNMDGFELGLTNRSALKTHDGYNPFPNYLVTNPHAIGFDVIPNAVGPTASTGKVMGQVVSGAGSDVTLNPELFIKEYEELIDNALGTTKAPDKIDEDVIQQAQAKRAELVKSIYKVENSIARAGNRIDAFKANTDLWQLELDETVAKKALETAQAASIAAHLKAQQFIKAEEVLNRIGAGVDANGNEIPLDQLSDDLRSLRLAVGILGEADAEAMRMTATALDEGIVGADALSTLSPVGDDKFFFPLTRTQNFEEVMESVWQSGFQPFGSHTQGPADIVEAMTAVTRFRSQGGFGAFLKHYDKLHNLLKGYMILKPGFHMRNYFSGVFMNYLHGVDISSYRQFQRAYWKFQHDEALRMGLDKRASDIKKAMGVRKIWGKVSEEHVDIIREMSEGNILGGSQGQVAGEFGVNPMVGGRRINFSAINPLDSRNAPLRLSRNIGVGTETFIRGVMGFDVLKKGGMVDEAFDTVVKFHFDYDDLSDFERSFVKRVVPFYTWTKKNLPLMLEQIGRNPAKMTAYLKAKKEIERGQEKPAIIPDYFIRQGGIQLPFKYKGENMFVLPDLPFKSPIEMIDPALQFRTDLSVAERARLAIGTLGTMATPIIKAPYEWNAKQNLWKGYTFDGRYQQVPTVFYKTPLLMPMMQAVGLATKENDIWMMRDYDLHAMAQMLPTFSDMRRLFPSEERYQQRTLSTWMSFVFGLGLRTNTKEEQERTLRAKFYEMQDEMRDMRSLQQAAETPA